MKLTLENSTNVKSSIFCLVLNIPGKDTLVSFPEGQIHEDLGLDPNLREFSKKIPSEFSSLISGANLSAIFFFISNRIKILIKRIRN